MSSNSLPDRLERQSNDTEARLVPIFSEIKRRRKEFEKDIYLYYRKTNRILSRNAYEVQETERDVLNASFSMHQSAQMKDYYKRTTTSAVDI